MCFTAARQCNIRLPWRSPTSTTRKLKCNHITEFAPFSGLSPFKLFSTSCSWSNSGGSPASWGNTDMTPTTTKRAKTFEKLPDWNFDQRDWCTDQISLKFAAAKKLRYHRKKRRIAAIISMLRCNYRYGPTYAAYFCTARTMSHVLVHMHNFRVPKTNKIASRCAAPRPPMTDVGTETAFRLDQRKHFRKSKHLFRSEVSWCDLHLRWSTWHCTSE